MSIFNARIIPVVVIGKSDHGRGLGEALVAGGIPVAGQGSQGTEPQPRIPQITVYLPNIG